MSTLQFKGLKLVTTVYWILLVYIVAALVWWFIALNQQNQQKTALLLQQLHPGQRGYAQQQAAILNARNRKTAQYLGEGATFLVLILVGAAFVYRATRRQIRLSQQQQNFMMAVTHELKTPIAITRLNLETIQKHQLSPGQRQKLIANTLHEADRLNALCNNILLASQLDSGGLKLNKTDVALSTMVGLTVNGFSQRFPHRQITATIAPQITIRGEETLLQMLLNNLVENALKYSPKQSAIEVGLNQAGQTVELYVADNGPGIPAKEREKVFEKFYRIGNEITRTAQGTGLGLYLCRKIAADHYAQIAITDNMPTGTVITVSFKT